jgi:hypothetical protein|tara:strand:+ start:751 stop:957 length:207 start_codon:yes stop_codon:yes gene_type:complete
VVVILKRKQNGQLKVAQKINGNIMGCGCNKTKSFKTPNMADVRASVKKVWESTKQDPKPVNVTKINKK